MMGGIAIEQMQDQQIRFSRANNMASGFRPDKILAGRAVGSKRLVAGIGQYAELDQFVTQSRGHMRDLLGDIREAVVQGFAPRVQGQLTSAVVKPRAWARSNRVGTRTR